MSLASTMNLSAMEKFHSSIFSENPLIRGGTPPSDEETSVIKTHQSLGG